MISRISQAVGALSLMAATAQAAPITYTLDQAFWGVNDFFSGVNNAGFQIQQQALVDANPGSFNHVRGTVTLDFESGVFGGVDLTVDYGFGADNTEILFEDADLNGTVTRSTAPFSLFSSAVPSQHFAMSFDQFFGPVQNFVTATGGTESLQSGRATFDLVVSKIDATDALYVTMDNAVLFEAQQKFERVQIPGCIPTPTGVPCVTLEPNGGGYSGIAVNLNSQTYGGGSGITVPAVPLPGAVWLMLAGLGGLFGVRRLS